LRFEALKKLINGDVRSQTKRNVIQSKAFSECLETVIARYHTNAITAAQVIEELIQLAKDIRHGNNTGERWSRDKNSPRIKKSAPSCSGRSETTTE
jgi:type I restriction enzyme R subunit